MSKFKLDNFTDHCSTEVPLFQWKSEFEKLCGFILENKIKSFLEIGVARGGLGLFLKNALKLPRIYGCDLFKPESQEYLQKVEFFHGDHQSLEYLKWRKNIGQIDLVFIDADHEKGFIADYFIEKNFKHKFIAFHDIANVAYPNLCAFWKKEISTSKIEFINTDLKASFGVPEITYPFFEWNSEKDYIEKFGRSCGIGITWG